jgi:TonB family protein
MLAGVFRPMILLPADLANWVGTEEQRAIVLHEVAHFDRRDHFVKLFQTFIGAIFFFHPAVRYALRRMDVERELACDEHVLAAGVCPATYAEVLLKVAERTLMARHRHQLAFHNSGRILERRITMISNYRNTDWKSSKLLRSTRAIAVVALAMLMLPDRAVVSGSGLSVPLRVAAIPVSFGSHQTPPAATQAAVQVRLSGTIYDQRGAVIPGVTVRLHSAANGSVQTTITNAAGQYGFSELNSGRYALNAELPGFSGVGKAIAVQGQSLVEDLVLARQVQSLATLTQTFSLTAQPPAQAPAQGFRLSGTITDQSGAVVPGVMVRLVNPADGSAQTTFTNEAGAYAFRQVSSLQYTLEAALPGFQTHSRQIRMQAQDAVENAVLVMAPVNTQIEVSVSAPQGAPLLPQTGTPGFAVRVGGDIAAPSLISQTKPEFPPNAHARGVQGAVRLLGVIAKDGTVTTLQLDPGFPVTSMELVRAAMEAVKQWRYRPAMLNGQPVEFITRITVNFSMN